MFTMDIARRVAIGLWLFVCRKRAIGRKMIHHPQSRVFKLWNGGIFFSFSIVTRRNIICLQSLHNTTRQYLFMALFSKQTTVQISAFFLLCFHDLIFFSCMPKEKSFAAASKLLHLLLVRAPFYFNISLWSRIAHLFYSLINR